MTHLLFSKAVMGARGSGRFVARSGALLAGIAVGILGLGGAIASAEQRNDLSKIQNIYLLPMPSGLEQFVALRLTENGAFQVVTDAKKADAVLTDRIGGDFEQRLQELNTDAAKAREDKEEHAKKEKKDGDLIQANDDFTNNHMRPLSRSHGAVFLVDRHTGDVLWSTAETPKSSQADDLMHAAEHIATRLSDAKGKPAKK